MDKKHSIIQTVFVIAVHFSLLTLNVSNVHGQVLQPVNWEYQSSRQQVGAGDTLALIFTAKIEEGWYLYSNDFDPELGPILTSFNFNPTETGTSYELVGETQAIGAKRKFDPIWEGEISYFENRAVFRQIVRVNKVDDDFAVSGRLSYQVCSNVSGKCIQGNEDFSFEEIEVIARADGSPLKDKKENRLPVEVKEEQSRKSSTSNDQRIYGKYNLQWREADDEAGGQSNTSVSSVQENTAVELPENIRQAGEGTLREPLRSTVSNDISDISAGLFQFAILAFLAGFAALATPCVFPMVPMTVTFFTHQKVDKKGQPLIIAISYGLSIILIYTLAGTLVAWVNGPAFANWLSTHWLPNLFFFGVFVFFALSFLGMFEITLPSGLVNAVDRKSDKGGWLGVFFMAFTLVLVSFSCTGPIVGALLVASAGGEVLKPVVGMASFALALALPFTLFAAFPHWMQHLPKSGGWLNSVKVVLGFLELALGLKFLSVADQVYHWELLDREVYLAIWIVIFLAIGFYLLGKIKLPHDVNHAGEKVGVPRLLLALCSFTFVVYLIPGMFGAPLKALAGYLPPMATHDFNLYDFGSSIGSELVNGEGLCEPPKYAYKLKLPHGIQGYFDLEEARSCAIKQGKPLFIDFTGHGCVNCREMEARVWSDPQVLKKLKEDFVVVALYIDEKQELPEEEWYTSTFDGKVKKTMGAQNADYQITEFNNNAQPLYVILDPYTMEMMGEPMGYELEVGMFLLFLEAGEDLI